MAGRHGWGEDSIYFDHSGECRWTALMNASDIASCVSYLASGPGAAAGSPSRRASG
ncbi:MAG TPA: hypothetical protein VLW44_08705 [Streptosporangiaceae bacterium]|nr:hypothetical protein [Streptosporangiaceae bacterium]